MASRSDAAAASGAALSLAEIEPGAEAVIERLEGSGPIDQRLLDLGLVPGTAVRVLRRAPLGDPALYELRGYQLCLRRSEAARVIVRRRADVPRP